jgi:hypothetical protein
MKTKTKTKNNSPVQSDPKSLSIVTAGLLNGKWGIVLSDGSVLDGVEEIIQTKPSYSDGYYVTAKIFIPIKDKPITKEIQ